MEEESQKYVRIINSDHDGQRVDNYLITHYKGVPKARLYRAMRKGEVRVNKKRVKQTDRLVSGDKIRLPPLIMSSQTKALSTIKDIDLSWLEKTILFEDDGLIVIDKPAGLAVHGGTGVGHSLLDFLAKVRPNQYLRLVHRLDQGTSGCILIAKSRDTLLDLQQQFKDHKVQKNYKAIVIGKVSWPQMTMKTKLEKQRDGETGVRVIESEDGKEAVSHFYLEKQSEPLSLLSITIETGRMHQIRFQAAKLGHPILGDDKYGDVATNARAQKKGYPGLHLHCFEMGFTYGGKDVLMQSLKPVWADHFLEIAKAMT
jgi:23S rRNA pseudouridine955/2504/2580 synthase